MNKKNRKNEEIGGGFFVFRRGKKTNRIAFGGRNGLPFEHPSLDAAKTEADRLATANKGERFAVFQEVHVTQDQVKEAAE